jgi:dihydrofolate synthase/folylpolyglutamate synthase
MGPGSQRTPVAAAALPAPPVTITVGGTNGKGSTCAMLERILLESGYTVGLYTSPHIDATTSACASTAASATMRRLTVLREGRWRRAARRRLTYFEFGTLGALAAFHEAEVDAVVLEVGLGGRLDAVNIIDADCAIVASIDIDHVGYLGDTREKIGFEKAGIFRAGGRRSAAIPIRPRRSSRTRRRSARNCRSSGATSASSATSTSGISSAEGREARAADSRAARRLAAQERLVRARGAGRVCRSPAGLPRRGEARPPLVTLAGPHAGAPGRPAIVLDVAHNPQAARSLADGLGDMGSSRTRSPVFAMLGDKDIGGVIDAMEERVDAGMSRRRTASARHRRRRREAARRRRDRGRREPSRPSHPPSTRRVGKRVRMIELSFSDRSIPWPKRCGSHAKSHGIHEPDASEIRRRGRQRLIGAVAIALLLIVFVPMLLDSEPRPARQEADPRFRPRERAAAAAPTPAPAERSPRRSEAGEAPTSPRPEGRVVQPKATPGRRRPARRPLLRTPRAPRRRAS